MKALYKKPLTFPGTGTIAVKATRTMEWAQKQRKCMRDEASRRSRDKEEIRKRMRLEISRSNFIKKEKEKKKNPLPDVSIRRFHPGGHPVSLGEGR